MQRFRISAAARADIVHILESSHARWGDAARARYRALLEATLRTIARSPEGRATRPRPELEADLRSLHTRTARAGAGVRDPVHVVFYRLGHEALEIVRVLHERMEPSSHVKAPARRGRRRR